MKQNPAPADWLGLVFLVAIWGSSFAMSKVAVAHMTAEWVMALRLTVAAAALIPLAQLQKQSPFALASPWRKYLWLGFVGNALPFFAVTWGMYFVSSGVAGLLMAAIPLFVVLLAHFVLPDEKLNIAKGAGFLLGFAGIVVLIGPQELLSFSFTGDELKGELAVLSGCLCYAIHAVSAKRLGFDHPMKQSSAVCFTGAAMGLAAAFALRPFGLHDIPMTGWAAVIGLGIFPTALATVLVYKLMDRTGPSFVSYSNYLVPIFAVLLGALALGETLDWNILFALILVLTGIAVSRLKSPKERPVT
jgi:drug/metabolite transporter (DMT)-like permease